MFKGMVRGWKRESDRQGFRGGNFKHFETSVGRSRNWAVGHCVITSCTDVRQYLKDRSILSKAYNPSFTTCSMKGVLMNIQSSIFFCHVEV